MIFISLLFNIIYDIHSNMDFQAPVLEKAISLQIVLASLKYVDFLYKMMNNSIDVQSP